MIDKYTDKWTDRQMSSFRLQTCPLQRTKWKAGSVEVIQVRDNNTYECFCLLYLSAWPLHWVSSVVGCPPVSCYGKGKVISGGYDEQKGQPKTSGWPGRGPHFSLSSHIIQCLRTKGLEPNGHLCNKSWS